jgi:hypothetical protein
MRDSSCLWSPKLSRKEEAVLWVAKHVVAKHCGMQFAAIDFMVSSPHTAPQEQQVIDG